MSKLTRKITSFLNFIKLFKNWRKAIQCWYSKTSGNTLLKLRNGTQYYVRPGTSDIQMIIELYIGRSYHKNLQKLDKDQVVIDIGANIGTFSIFMAKRTNNVSGIYAYEPFPDNFQIFKNNLKINNINSVKAYRAAVADTETERSLNVDDDNAMHSFFTEGGNKIPVKTTTLENIFKVNKLVKCDFLKLDCEGAEYEIILTTPAEVLQKIKIISIEYHCSEKYSFNNLKDVLDKNGFAVDITESEVEGYGFIDAVNTK